jgi:hypothetical protein
MKKVFILFFSFSASLLFSQTNLHLSNPIAKNILKGNFDPSAYQPAFPVSNPNFIIQNINANVSADSLKSYLERLDDFETRNTGSDTLSASRGIGAARAYIHQKFAQFSNFQNGRLITSYFSFDQDICGMMRHKNVLGILPGSDTINKDIIIIEGHFDSRCETSCDTACAAHGMEDNGSGTALVIELARVMSFYSFKQTLVFMATTGEEQGLLGARAFADFLTQENISVEAVLNNDVIGGVICGQTSSAPSCPGKDLIDSTQVRLFSGGGYNSTNKCLTRFIKLQYLDELISTVNVPMLVTLMTSEDRTGRGGDHIPFRQNNIPAIRFTSAHEHGNAGVGPNYHDRQHTSDDILGVDTDNDNVLDSFYVDFNYLARNAVINGAAITALALGPEQPDYTITPVNGDLEIVVNDPYSYGTYKVGFRTTGWDFDTLMTFTGSSAILNPGLTGNAFVSLMAVDNNNIESLANKEQAIFKISIDENELSGNEFILLQNKPNPFDESTAIGFYVPTEKSKQAVIKITSLDGRVIKELETEVSKGMNEVIYDHGYGIEGNFVYSLYVDGALIGSKKMTFIY